MIKINIGTLTAHINAETRGLDRGMNRAKRKMRSASRSIKRSAKMATVALAGIGAASAYFVKAASDSQELNNVVSQSFGEMTDSINNWAAETGDAMNRSTYQMRRFAALNQAILKPMLGTSEATSEMSKDLTQLAVDLGSFFNVADKQAFEAIQSGLMGMVRPLRQFGIDLTQSTLEAYALEQGIEANIEKMSQAEKVQLRYNYLMENTGHIQGDAVRTAHTLANQLKGLQGQWRNLRTEFGNYLLPAATKVVSKTTEMIEYLADLPDEVQRNILKFGTLATAILSAVAALGLMVIAIETVLKAGALLAGFIGLITSPIVLGTLAIAAASYALYTAWTENWGGIRDKTTTIWNDHLEPIYEKMKEWFNTAWDWVIETGGNAWEWLTNTTWKEKWEDIKSWMQAGWNWTIDVAGEGWKWLDEQAPWLTESMETAWNWTANLVNDTAKWIKNTAWPWIKDGANTVWNWSVNAVNFSKDTIKGDIDIMPNFNVENMAAKGVGAIADALGWVERTEGAYYLGRAVGFITFGAVKLAIDAIQWLGGLLAFDDRRGNRMAMNIDELVINVSSIAWQFAEGVSDSFWKALTGKTAKQLGGQTTDIFSSWDAFSDWAGRNVNSDNQQGYALGGMTSGSASQVAGVVHGGEWVMPNWMVKRFPQLTAMLEGMRKKGYDNGGGVGLNLSNIGQSVSNMDLSGMGEWIKNLSQNMGRIGEVFIRTMKSLVDIMIKLMNVIGENLGLGKIGDDLKSTLKDLDEWFNNLFDTGGGQSSTGGTGPSGGLSQHPRNQGWEQQVSLSTKLLNGLNDVYMNTIDALREGMPVLQSLMSDGGGFKSWVGIITSLITQSKAFQTILETLNPVLRLLADTVGMVLLPIVKILEPPLKLVAEVLRWVAELIIKVWNGIVDVLDMIIFWTSLDKWKVSMEELGENLEGTADAAKEAADAMRNVPNGVKVALRGFQSATGTKQRQAIPSAQTGGYVRRTGLVNVHAGEVIQNKGQQGGDINVIFQGDVYGTRDFERKVNKAVDNAKKRNGMNRYGLERGGN